MGDIGLSVIVFAELLMGKPPSSDALDQLTLQMPLVSFGEYVARACARTPFRRARYDRLLAGHALSLGLPIITVNRKDFVGVPGLAVEDWTQ